MRPLLNAPIPENRGPSSSGFGACSARRASAAMSCAFERVRQARDDLVLHVEEIGQRLVEPLGPEMIAGLGVDELHVDAHAIAAALDAAFEHVAYVQLAADLS